MMTRTERRILKYLLAGAGYFAIGGLIGLGERVGRDYSQQQTEKEAVTEFISDEKPSKEDYEKARRLQDSDRP